MNGLEKLCTCTDKKCPNHPANHDKGCVPCIAKCRGAREIPSCFFNMLGLSKKPDGYTFEDFAALVMRDKK